MFEGPKIVFFGRQTRAMNPSDNFVADSARGVAIVSMLRRSSIK